MNLSRSTRSATRFMAAFVLVLMLAAGASAQTAKYVFFMIGDGMSLTQRNAAEIYLASKAGHDARPGIVKLAMSTMPIQGMSTTYSTNSIITDSAAAGTALATGNKTASGVIAMDPTGTVSYETIAQKAHKKGMKVGIVSSVSIEHATPASFYAHRPSRKDYYELALQLPESGFEYFAGGGFTKPKGKKGDQPDVVEIIKGAGYCFVEDMDGFRKLSPSDGKVVAVNPVLKDGKALPYEIDRRDDSISLAEFTAKGVELLDNPNGFFMMVEGGKIDWACHANDAVSSIGDTIAFDQAVQVALDFYRAHPDETLVVVTGDHETGGLSIGFAGTKYDTFFQKLDGQTVSYEDFDLVISSYRKSTDGKGSMEEFFPQVESAFGIKMEELSQSDVAELKRAFSESMKGKDDRSKDQESFLLYGGYEPFSMALTHLINRQAGISWTSYAHTGVPVPVSAAGVAQDSFNGYYDNTDIYHKMASAMGL
nr:alkaline phosphatase [uncultured Dethiosulfovibrio sp.]